MPDKNEDRKNLGPHAPGGVNRSREGQGGPTTTGPGETSVSRGTERRASRPGLEDIGGTGTDMDDMADDMDFDEGLTRASGRHESGRPIDEEYE